MLSYKSLLSGN